MRKIPNWVVLVLQLDPRMKQCALWFLGDCEGRIEWHHNFIYAGRQVNIPECILGVCKVHHDQANNKEVKQRLDWVMFSLWTEKIFEMFSKSAKMLRGRQAFLNKRYGVKRE